MAEKKTQGRKKIELKKREDEAARNITFSKRRRGVFKKASELATLCGAEVAVIVFSPGRKAFSFGSPSVESVINRYQQVNQPEESITTRYIRTIHEARQQQLNQRLNELKKKIEEEEEEEKRAKSIPDVNWNEYLGKLSLSELQQLKEKLQQLKEKMVLLTKIVAQPSNIEPHSEASSSYDQNVGLSSIEEKQVSGSPIPHDWLKL